MKSRRKFIEKVAFVSTLTAIPFVGLSKSKPKNNLVHQVFFWLNDGEDLSLFIEETRALSKCKTVAKFHVGTPAPTEARDVVDHSYQVACTFFFKSVEDQNIYQTDPIHLKFIERNSNRWKSVKVYDFILS
jgi:hypothetical protein